MLGRIPFFASFFLPLVSFLYPSVSLHFFIVCKNVSILCSLSCSILLLPVAFIFHTYTRKDLVGTPYEVMAPLQSFIQFSILSFFVLSSLLSLLPIYLINSLTTRSSPFILCFPLFHHLKLVTRPLTFLCQETSVFNFRSIYRLYPSPHP